MDLTAPGPVLHLGGAGTFTAAFVVALIFVGVFIMSFAFGRPPGTARGFSRAWARSWLSASLPRLAAAAVFSGTLFFASAQFGGGGDAEIQEALGLCDSPLPPLRPGPVVQSDFDTAAAGIEVVIDLTSQGDTVSSRDIFFRQVHDLTHNADGPLRTENEELAKRLCVAVAQIESDFAFRAEAPTVAERAEGIRDLLGQAAEELGFDW